MVGVFQRGKGWGIHRLVHTRAVGIVRGLAGVLPVHQKAACPQHKENIVAARMLMVLSAGIIFTLGVIHLGYRSGDKPHAP